MAPFVHGNYSFNNELIPVEALQPHVQWLFIRSPFGQRNSPFIDRRRQIRAARREWQRAMTQMAFRRQSRSLGQDVDHFFTQMSQPSRLNFMRLHLNLHLNWRWPLYRHAALITRSARPVTAADGRRLWIWEYTQMIVIGQTVSYWVFQRSEYTVSTNTAMRRFPKRMTYAVVSI